MASEIRQVFYTKSITGNYVLLFRDNRYAAQPDHLGFSCAHLMTTATTAPTEFYPSATCQFYEMILRKISTP